MTALRSSKVSTIANLEVVCASFPLLGIISPGFPSDSQRSSKVWCADL
jgi:hypothetical protein